MYACMKEADSLDCGFPEWWIVSCFIANLDDRYKDFTQRTALNKVLPTLETVSAELREVDRMHKRETEAKAYRTQATRGAIAHKEDKKKSDEAKKNISNAASGGDSKKHCPTCKKAEKNDNYHPDKCWRLHPDLMPDKFKKKNKDKEDKDVGEVFAKAAYVFQARAVIDFTRNSDFGFARNAVVRPDYIDEEEDVAAVFETAPEEATEVAYASAAAAGNSTSTEDEWIVDSGSSHPMTPSKTEFITYNSMPNSMPVYIADGGKLNAVGRGTIALEGVLPDGTIITTNLTNALHVPKLSTGSYRSIR